MAAIKYEKDRAANTLLPNWNTYGRYDIPSMMLSITVRGLFVIQILCLIVAFFLLFASLGLIYGVHTWSRFLVWPWFPCMASSILTSLAYCIMWWTGDVRDYWLVLTIVEIFGVLVNVYCFFVIAVFYKRMQQELKYYEEKRSRRKYDRFSQADTSGAYTDQDDSRELAYREWDDRYQPQDKYPPPPDPYIQRPPYYGTPTRYSQEQRFEEVEQAESEPIVPMTDTQRPIQQAQSVPSLFEDFRDVPRGSVRRHRHRSYCKCCDRHHHHHSHHHHHKRRRSRSRCRKDSSDACSSDYSATDSTSSRHRHRRHSRHYSDNESDLSNFTENGKKRRKHREERKGPRQVKRDDRDREFRSAETQVASEIPEMTQPSGYPGAFTIPQHIVIPPVSPDEPDNDKPRKYKINSEITISYDPRRGGTSQVGYAPSPRPDSRPLSRGPLSTQNHPISITSNV
uniref:Uncharacterized protein n=1 Tax=Acrobeloides nanus TaxID=290746 RepID=A0A914C092_9BILA